MEPTKQVGAWIRVSTEDQAKGDSPEHHEIKARQYAANKGWEIVSMYHLEALSGKSVVKYAQYKEMLADIRSGKITALIFSRLARVARNTKELIDLADIFEAEDAELVAIEQNIDTSTPAGRLFYTMLAAMAQWEREEIAARVAASIPIRAKLGKSLGGTQTLGYKWIGEKGEQKQMVVDEKYAPVRKLVYELFLKLRRKNAVAAELNKAGYRTRKGKKFSDTTIKQLLRDPTAKGWRRVNYTKRSATGNKLEEKPQEEWVLHPCPALVSEEVWDECNRILDESLLSNKKPGPRAKHLFAGFVQCADCGKSMYVFHSTKLPTYRCQPCGTRIPAQDLEDIYHEQLKTFLLTDKTVSQYVETLDVELAEKQKLLFAISEERKNLTAKMDSLIDMRINGELTKEIFSDRFKPIEERALQIKDQIPELEADIAFFRIQHASSDTILTGAKDMYDRWPQMTHDDRRMVVEGITDVIRVGKQDINIKLSYMPTRSPKTAEAHPKKENHIQVNPGNSQSNL